MYKSIALFSSVAALTLSHALPVNPHRQRLQPPENYLNPKLFAPLDDKIVAVSRGSKYRPDLSGSQYIDFDAPQGAARRAIHAGAPIIQANPSDQEGIPSQSQIMHELGHIIKANNAKIKVIKKGGALEDQAEPIENAQDPNNAEQFEKLPRVNERIPIVDREIIKKPMRKERIPVANDYEGIVYNVPKVHERIPIQDNNQIDLEDTKNVDAIIKRLDAGENKVADEEKKVVGDIHHEHHHHHLHRGADMVDKAVRAA